MGLVRSWSNVLLLLFAEVCCYGGGFLYGDILDDSYSADISHSLTDAVLKGSFAETETKSRYLVEKANETKGGGEVEGKASEELDSASLTTAVLLMGVVFLVATLFYLVNSSDQDIRQRTWSLLSDSLSIFCAVLFYQAVDVGFDTIFPKDDPTNLRFVVGMLHFFVWHLGVQIWCVVLCHWGVFGKQTVKAGCVLSAHFSGFAAKEYFNTLMQSKPFKDTLGLTFVAILICLGIMVFFMGVSAALRQLCIYPCISSSKVEACRESIHEAENDMSALSLGFSIFMFLRYIIHGELPSEEFDDTSRRDIWEIGYLGAFSIAFIFVTVALVKAQFSLDMFSAVKGRKSCIRLIEAFQLTMVTANAWCLLYFGKWLIYDTHLVEHPILARVVLASLVSYYCIFILFIANLIAERTEWESFRKAAWLITKSFGLAVAFSWEQSFDASVETIAEAESSIMSEFEMKILMAFVLILVVGPAWKMYVFPKALEDDEKEKAEEEHRGISNRARQEDDKANGEAAGVAQQPGNHDDPVAQERPDLKI